MEEEIYYRGGDKDQNARESRTLQTQRKQRKERGTLLLEKCQITPYLCLVVQKEKWFLKCNMTTSRFSKEDSLNLEVQGTW